MMQTGMYILLGFNIAAVFFFIIWGLICICKKKENGENNNDSNKENWSKATSIDSRKTSRPLVSILKPCSENVDSDEIENESDAYDENGLFNVQNYQLNNEKERRAHFAAEPFLISK